MTTVNPVIRLALLIKEQAEDPGLWFIAERAPEAYLQMALRELHAAVEALLEDIQR